MAVRAVKKITAKEVMGSKMQKVEVDVPVLNDDNTPVLDKENNPIMRKVKVAVERDMYAILGTAHAHRVGKSQYGDSYVFVGNFEARRLEDGETFVSTECIFPPIADDLAVSAYIREKAVNKEGSIEFAFIIGIAPDNRGTEGFKFTCKPIKVGEATSDPLADLKSSLGLSFAEVLGLETMERIGLPAPGSQAAQIEHKKGKKEEATA